MNKEHSKQVQRVFTQGEARKLADGFFASQGAIVVGSFDDQQWTCFEYDGRKPFWAATLKVYGPHFLQLTVYRVQIHEDDVKVISKKGI